MKITLFDRHAEHVDATVPLCPHGEAHRLNVGDTFVVTASMDAPGWLWTSRTIEAKAEVEIRVVGKTEIEIVLNLPDYLAAKASYQDDAPASRPS